MDNKLAGTMVMQFFHSRTSAHVLHLQTKSYAEHKALGDYYDGIVDAIDSFAEAYQGAHGAIDFDVSVKFELASDAISMLTKLRFWMDNNRKAISARQEIQNLIDGIVDLIDSTLYKLKFLS